MNLGQLFEGIVEGVRALPTAEVTGISSDSRQVREGFVYVGIRGGRHDGRDFVPDAVARGAVACIVEGPAPTDSGGAVPALSVPDARLAVALLASRFHGNPSSKLKVVGTTGTNGKTTVSYLVRDIFNQSGLQPGLIGTIAYEIGERAIPAARTTPEAAELQGLLAQMVSSGCQSAVLEVSSHSLDQKRVAGIDFDVGVFTNLTGDHLDYHLDMERYFAAKAGLFRQLGSGKKSAYAVINADDPFGRRLADPGRYDAEVITYGTGRAADVRAEIVELDARGSRITMASPWGNYKVETPLMGRFNVSNVLAAMTIAGAMGLDIETAGQALKHASGAPGRLEEIPTDTGFQVFVDYAHTDDALSNVLTTLREVTPGRLIAVFGCGGDRDKTKRPLMGRVAEIGADLTIATSDNPRSEDPADIIEQIVAGVHNRNTVLVEIDRRDAIHKAISLAREGDIVLIAGKGHENFQEIGSRTIPFDDRQVAGDALAEAGAVASGH
ncbi:MAG: UDP-N-acetylmuramoyl-L-alanyl-D-glutamate--2,6-diaminopimelate ligase [Kiritimatiellia bacterium]|jgi:UDP-N-acetylmuramoyl-L-alanyl-D-glutamate--2,6-diaminopimelate ligase|nr:UDP-N-acetylmuramoyl-L-alanyl-D-glutamate--2,6-diaminopimelate ligase [Kiritimatiellia bacterium]MDP6630802.1 UDP-N-acetylmuramoyl-L-alanyl-D-glutamate--2,6-diaminopimelate ligase [Kiritimatiellia bacterium]MDP6809334.1 UDP-N-acetylmuramoyl-L-alanyl-D-glutamate--2,6-diaminopimelate ligase [Kiritimatiellia bacterium]MDP7023988.1 UDP-N-acetylmuramoyl-L-alanyl-D-glutamate--2,6-diaminopimelate ligase [Kiritimatiellia bacterium]